MEDLDVGSLFTRPGTYVLGLFIWIFTLFTRRLVENIAPWLKKQADANSPKITYATAGARWWNEVILYAIPVVYGCLAGFMKNDFLFGPVAGLGARIMFGGVTGYFSGFLYKIIRKVIHKKLGIDVEPGTHSSAPPPPEPPVGG